jgi:hypothetical protein
MMTLQVVHFTSITSLKKKKRRSEISTQALIRVKICTLQGRGPGIGIGSTDEIILKKNLKEISVLV